MSHKSVDAFLHRLRYPAILVTLVFLLYCNLYMWLYVPFADFRYIWQLGYLQVVELDETTPTAEVLQLGDLIVAVDNEPTYPGKAIFPLPKKDIYNLDVQRNSLPLPGIEIHFPAEPGIYAIDYRLPAGLLSLVLWVVGPLALHLARRDNVTATRVGYIFMLGGVIVIGIQGFVTGVPWAWLGGTPLTFLGATSLVYLGLVPRSAPLPRWTRVSLKTMFVGAIILGITAVLEGLFLFPQRLSLFSITGISLYQGGILALALGLLVCFLILLWRAVQMSPSYQRQQIFVLLLFIALGILPVTLLTFIPQFLFGVLFVPFPISIALAVLFPLGYFYVIFRRGYLGLDILFSKVATLLILVVTIVAFYGTLLFVLQDRIGSGSDSIVAAAVTLAPAILLTRLVDAPINIAVQSVFFGRITLQSDAQLPEIASKLSLEPELTTLQAVVKSIATDFNIPQAILVLRDDKRMLPAAVQVNAHDWQPISTGDLKPFFDPIVRAANNNEVVQSPLLREYEWMELIVPIVLRNEQTGFLALARPVDGYFNVRQVRFLSRVADMLAIGSEAIFLFETSRELSKQLFKSQEAERLKLASEIHDNPLQTLGFVRGKLHNLANELELESPEVAGILLEQTEYLQKTIAELRNVCAGLHPAIISKGFQMIATGLAQEFRRQHDLDIEVMLDSRVPDETTESNLEAARAVFYILREALNNIVKHAGADKACIEMNFDNGKLSMMITDDGVGGLQNPLSYSELIKGGHFGLANMLERADGVNGQLAFQPNLPQGTCVVLEVPIALSNTIA